MTQPIKIVIAEDHPIFRKGLVEVIESAPANRVIHQAPNGANLVDAVRDLKPDIAIVDVELPVLSGFEAARRIRRDHPQVGVIFLTMYKGEDAFNEAMDLGAMGYVVSDPGFRAEAASIGADGYVTKEDFSQLFAIVHAYRPKAPSV